MNGIMTDDFELLLKQNNSILIEVLSDLSKVQKKCNEISLNLNSKDLNFIKNKLDLELSQFSRILNKLNGYQNTLKSICSGYQNQYAQVVNDSKKLIS